jgi:hypothetical protein
MVDAMRLSSDATPRDVKGHDNRRSIQSTASYASIKLGVDAHSTSAAKQPQVPHAGRASVLAFSP